jgi:geranylgeranyl diphosphate synthase type I
MTFTICYHKSMLFHKIKNKLDGKLKDFIADIDKQYSLSTISPLIFNSIKDFVLRSGKRIRPILFVVGYLGFCKRTAANLYTSALAIELLHDFLLVHDDIIDKSDTRRGKPSMHALLNAHLKSYKKIKFNGQDLSIVLGDIMYAMAINAFLSINETMERKERALRKFIDAAVYTGCGEFIELINGANQIEKITKDSIYKVYDYKTAHYTFSTPLATGAILAGAPQSQIDKLFSFGIYLGRAFQIKDDILGMFEKESTIGKSTLTDLQEGKKTLLVWYAYNNTSKKNKILIRNILAKKKINKLDVFKMRSLIESSKALEYAKNEISLLLKEARNLMASSKMKAKYKTAIYDYCDKFL